MAQQARPKERGHKLDFFAQLKSLSVLVMKRLAPGTSMNVPMSFNDFPTFPNLGILFCKHKSIQ
jgi:hypothetical protein